MKEVKKSMVAMIILLVITCGKKERPKLTTRNVYEEEIGRKVTCVVTGDTFTIEKETKAIEYKGKTYYFCCPGCDIKFLKNPEKYISKEEKKIIYWTCPMHPQIKAEKKGKCPICGMELIPVYEEKKGELNIKEDISKVIGIRSEPVKKIKLTKKINFPGRVIADNELYLAQKEFLALYEIYKNNKEERIKEMVEAAKFRLTLFGYDEKGIQELIKNSEPDRNLIYSGEKVWVIANIPTNDLNLIKPGQEVIAKTTAFPSEKFNGKIRLVPPVVEPETRTIPVRIELENPQKKLKLEMYVDLLVIIPLGERLAIPKEAIIDTGKRKIVYLDLGDGRYMMKEIEAGQETDEFIEVVAGLSENDLVVTQGNFLLDSQTTLTGGQALLYSGAEEIKEKK